jgi:trigger factor
MKIVNQTSDGLKRSYNVFIPSEEIESAMTAKFHETAKKVKLAGFRPGKVPPDVVRRMYGDSIRAEVTQTVITESAKKVLKDGNLTVSFRYTTDIVKNDNVGIEFSMKFEVVPAFEVEDVSDLKIEKYIAKIEKNEPVEFLESIRKNRKNWLEDKTASRVEKGHRVVIDLFTLHADKRQKDAETKDAEITIGDENAPEDFWKPLIGAKISEIVDFSVKYPTNFSNKHIAGKSVLHRATIKKILKATEYKMDDEFAKSVGLENLEKAKEWAESQVLSKYNQISEEVLRRDLLDKIADMYDFDVPENMLDIEYKDVYAQITEEGKKLGKDTTPEIQEECRTLAKRRVRLGFIIAEIAKREKINVTKTEIAQTVRNIAAMYPGQEQVVYNLYKRDDAIRSIIGPILERKVVGFLLGKMKVSEKECSTKDLIDRDEETFDFFKDDNTKIEKRKRSSAKAEKTEVKKSKEVSGKKIVEQTA